MRGRGSSRLVLLTDFDGTITDVDSGEMALKLFADGDWQRFDHALEAKQITLESSLKHQFALVKASAEEVKREVLPSVHLRRGAKEVVLYCRDNGIPFVIVSGGLDFLIRGLLQREGMDDHVKLVAPSATETPEGLILKFPRQINQAIDFKSSLVERYKKAGKTVLYIGDGLSDYEAIKRADVRFVTKGSQLDVLCRRDETDATEITDFLAVRSYLISRFGGQVAL